MVVTPLMERLPYWTSAPEPDQALAVCSHITLSRNLADFPFPERCTEDEKRGVEERILQALDHVNLMASGHYYPLDELDTTGRRFLAERRLLTVDMIRRRGPAGVFVADNQRYSIIINSIDHLTLRVVMPGQQLQEAWSQINQLDDALGTTLDFAFNERLGFLSSALDSIGTSLKASTVLHLPALTLTGGVQAIAEKGKESRVNLYGLKAGGDPEKTAVSPTAMQGDAPLTDATLLEHTRDQNLVTDHSGGICGPLTQALGSLYLAVNTSSLGESEEELIFHVRQLGAELLEAEQQARDQLLESSTRGLEDRVNRALGVACHARLLSFMEGVEVLSALRLGVVAQRIPQLSVATINEVLLASQGAQIETAKGQSCDGLTLSIERADLFRSRFAN